MRTVSGTGISGIRVQFCKKPAIMICFSAFLQIPVAAGRQRSGFWEMSSPKNTGFKKLHSVEGFTLIVEISGNRMPRFFQLRGK